MGLLEMTWAIAFFCIGTILIVRLGYLTAKDEYVSPVESGISVIGWMLSIFLGAAFVLDAEMFTARWNAACSWLQHYSTSDTAAALTARLAALVLAGVCCLAVGLVSMGLGWLLFEWTQRRRWARKLVSGNVPPRQGRQA